MRNEHLFDSGLRFGVFFFPFVLSFKSERFKRDYLRWQLAGKKQLLTFLF